jgi:hypothetical protein
MAVEVEVVKVVELSMIMPFREAVRLSSRAQGSGGAAAPQPAAEGYVALSQAQKHEEGLLFACHCCHCCCCCCCVFASLTSKDSTPL